MIQTNIIYKLGESERMYNITRRRALSEVEARGMLEHYLQDFVSRLEEFSGKYEIVKIIYKRVR